MPDDGSEETKAEFEEARRICNVLRTRGKAFEDSYQYTAKACEDCGHPAMIAEVLVAAGLFESMTLEQFDEALENGLLEWDI
jgi:hypothetical protein